MKLIIDILMTILYAAPFVLLCFLLRKVNINRVERGKQFFMPFISLLYCGIVVYFLDKISKIVLILVDFLEKYVPFFDRLNLDNFLIYILNALIVLGFLIVKLITMPVIKAVWGRSERLMDVTSGVFYEYEEDVDKWVLKKEYGQVKTYCSGIYYAVLIVSTTIFILAQRFGTQPFFKAAFYPVFGIIVVGEVINFLSGITKNQFVEDILGEDEEAYKVANYGMLREVLRKLFGNRVLYDTTADTGLDISSSFETLEELCDSEDQIVRNLGQYFKAMKESGEDIDPNYVKSCVGLIQGKSTLFANPFYRDLTNYLTFPILRQLMRYRKCLVIMGRDSATDDVKKWLEECIFDTIHTDTLWKVDVLTKEHSDADIGIMKLCDLYNQEIQKNNEEFLKRVGFVFIIEPSRLLTTGQMGLSLLVNRFDESKEQVVYCACDRNCDGLVDALSHILKTTITEVLATTQSSTTASLMCWEADGPYLHHKIFSNISRYLGVGTEINSVAMKYQIENTKWISSEKFPVTDMKWIAGQYYKKICNYTNLPVSQESFNKAFLAEANLWNSRKEKNAFLVVEDEFQNLFEMTRLFSTRAKQQGFINVISENYLLRDYMLGNVHTFLTDPKAIPTIVADYARTERNTVLKLLMRMSNEQVGEDELIQTLYMSGIKFDDPFDKLKELIRKHCPVEEVGIRVYFREQLMEDALRTEAKKYFAIEGNSEIAEYAKNLKNAYYLAEDEKGETYYIGAKLYGHVFQALIPGQFLTYAGKYYEVQSITSQNGVVLRRAADHINERKYYRQMRHIKLSDWSNDQNVGGIKTISDIQISKGYCTINVQTEGFLELVSYDNLKDARKVCVSGIPERNYRNKMVLRIQFPQASDQIRYTICLMLNEIFKTTYPDSYQYVCAVTPFQLPEDLPENLKYAIYTMESEADDTGIYIVEDSEIDLGLIASVERNLKRYFEIVTEVLTWHDLQMNEMPQVEEPKEEYVPNLEEEPQNEEDVQISNKKKRGFFGRIFDKIKSIFKRKKKKDTEEQTEPTEEDAVENEPLTEEPVENEPVENELSEDEPITEEASTEADSSEAESIEEVSEEDAIEEPLQDRIDDQLDISGEDEEVISKIGKDQMTEYQKKCFLKFGYEEFSPLLDFEGTRAFLSKYNYDKGSLRQVRDSEAFAEEYEKTYNPNKSGVHYCDFCGVELVGGEYELLKDGRERCNRCSATALKTGEEFKEIFKTVMRNMEIFYGIRLNVAIKVRMTDAKKIAKHFGQEFVATPGFDGRTLGFAQKDSSGYSIYVENGSPKLAAMATIAHELTHIWQYENWNDKEIKKKYGAHNRLLIYEGMAKWAEIQYLICLNEISYAKRQEIITRLRNDEYGRGFVEYTKKYSISYGGKVGRTPFDENPPL